jgi:hypothetical protein
MIENPLLYRVHGKGEHKRPCPKRSYPSGARLGSRQVHFMVKKVHPYKNQKIPVGAQQAAPLPEIGSSS